MIDLLPGSRFEMLEDLEWRQRQRMVRAIFRGRPVEDVRDARAAVDACRELRGQWVPQVVGHRGMGDSRRDWPHGGTWKPWSVLELLLSVGLPAFALAVATWWTYRGLPRRLDRAERANRSLLRDK